MLDGLLLEVGPLGPGRLVSADLLREDPGRGDVVRGGGRLPLPDLPVELPQHRLDERLGLLEVLVLSAVEERRLPRVLDGARRDRRDERPVPVRLDQPAVGLRGPFLEEVLLPVVPGAVHLARLPERSQDDDVPSLQGSLGAERHLRDEGGLGHLLQDPELPGVRSRILRPEDRPAVGAGDRLRPGRVLQRQTAAAARAVERGALGGHVPLVPADRPFDVQVGEGDLPPDVERVEPRVVPVVERRQAPVRPGEVGVHEDGAWRGAERQLPFRRGVEGLAPVDDDEDAVGAEVESHRGLDPGELRDGGGLHRQHQPELPLRLGQPPVRAVRESDVPLVPRPLAGRELEPADERERLDPLRLRFRPQTEPERRRGGDQLGDLSDRLEVDPLAGHGGAAVCTDRDQAGPGPEGDLASTGGAVCDS